MQGSGVGMMYLLAGIASLSLLSALLLLALALLEKSLWNQDLVLGGDGAVPQLSVGPLVRWGQSPERRIAAQWSAGSHAFSADTPKSGVQSVGEIPSNQTSLGENAAALSSIATMARTKGLRLQCLVPSTSHSGVPKLTARRTEAGWSVWCCHRGDGEHC